MRARFNHRCRCGAAVLLAIVPVLGLATDLSQVALQDVCGQGGSDVDHQTAGYVAVKAYANSHSNNRKALFLFNLASFAGHDLTGQYIHQAAFVAHAYDSQCDDWTFRLYGLTDTASNDDSRWDETIAAQSAENWPDRYWGAYQYPDTGHGARLLDTQAGPSKDTPVSFDSDLVRCVRWGVGRDAGFGYSATNPDGQITLLLAREEYDNDISQFHSRQSDDAGYRPRLDLDVRFPEIGLAIAGSSKASGSTYDFGSFQGLGGAVSRTLVVDNAAGEALSSLHVRTLTLQGRDAWAFQLGTPGGTDFYLAGGTSTSGYEVRFNPGANYGLFDDARVVLTCNDENESTYTVYLRATHTPAEAGVVILDPAAASTNVPYRVQSLAVSGGSSNVAGRLWWTNSAGGGGTQVPGPGGAWGVDVGLAVGANLITVSGSNLWGSVVSDNVTVVRSDNLPALSITNPPGWFAALPNGTDSFQLVGTVNENVVGTLRWTGSDGQGGEWPAVSPWTGEVGLDVGVHALTVVATNDTGQAVTGRVTLARQPSVWLNPGAVVVPGWRKSGGIVGGSCFILATLTNVPTGTVLYFTDNGAFSTGQFLGASEGDANGLESLCALACGEAIPAGTVLLSDDPARGCVWVSSGRICAQAPQSYDWPSLDTKGDQFYVFQSDAPSPLLWPDRHLAVLDDTGRFEPPINLATGDIPPGLVAGDTAWTFNFGVNTGARFDFTPFLDWILTPPQWRTRFATSKHWLVNPLGPLPTGHFLVGELLVLSLKPFPNPVTLTFTCAYPDVPCIVQSCTNLQSDVWETAWEGTTRTGPQSEEVASPGSPAWFRVQASPAP